MNCRSLSVILLLVPLVLGNSKQFDAAIEHTYEPDIGDVELTTVMAPTGNTTAHKTTLPPFIDGFVASISFILVSELGDKTWFIAVVMAMRHSRLTVYAGAMSALSLMTILSVTIGWLTQVIPRIYVVYASGVLMVVFGLKMLYDGYKMSPNEGKEEFEGVEKEVNEREQTENDRLLTTVDGQLEPPKPPPAWRIFLKIFVETFVLTFLAEWGDRSQMTTVLLAASRDVFGVALGGIVGHAACTGLAVIGGKLAADCIPVRIVTMIGGVVFLIYAAVTFFTANSEVLDAPAAVAATAATAAPISGI